MNFHLIIDQVSDKHELDRRFIMSKIRTKPVCAARHEAMHRLKEVGYTVSQIGQILSRDHTTITNGIRRHLSQPCEIQVMPKQPRHTRFYYQLRKIGLPTGSVKEMMNENLSDEVVEHSINKAAAESYSSLAEYFADIITEQYFEEKQNEQRSNN